jgi:predicted O-methyltransferase YrrM
LKNREAFQYGFLDDLGRAQSLELMAKRPDWAVASISEYDAAFLYGAVKELKPVKVLEVGVASGWGSCLIMHALKAAGVDQFTFYGVDIASRFFYDEKYATGGCVEQMMPELLTQYHLQTDCVIADVIESIGGDIDFAFIDANHMHPWAALDMLAILPFMCSGSYIALHDLSLCRKEDQLHKNRGPKYLYEGWEEEKAHSVQTPTMIGVIRTGSDPNRMLAVIEDVLYTPWEVPVDHYSLERIDTLVERFYGAEWGKKIHKVLFAGNDIFNREQSGSNLVTTPANMGLWSQLKRMIGA